MKRYVIVMLILSIIVAGGLSWFASTHPDGLERVAEDTGFSDRAGEPSFTLMPDYTIPGREGFVWNALAGIAGVLAVFAVAWGAGRLLSRGRR